ncbi:MAG: tetratricopeptide repeat protein [Candidatus Poribacteria bacterium]|nr:tetratricopeptide repeat protein [Candidatus Poribacteria bacterium]
MSVMKYTQKYLLRVLLCVIVVIGIIGIGGLIHHHRSSKETVQASVSTPEGELPIPELSTKRSTSAGHFHADGTFHADAPSQVIGNKNPSGTQRVSPTRRASRQSAANKSSLGWITWKYGHTRISARSPGKRHSEPLPQEIQDAVWELRYEQSGREWLHSEVTEFPETLENKAELYDYIDFVGERFNLPEPRQLLLDDEGTPLAPFTESEFEEEKLRRLVGDRDLEAATQFLEQHGHYNELLLSRLSDERGFDYLYRIAYPNGSGIPDNVSVREYAERVVASDPGHLKARLFLADAVPRGGVFLEEGLSHYESILVDYPDSAHAWIEAGDVLMYLERPFQAVSYIEKGHALGARHGHFSAGKAYQQLGDYKTAWVYLKKALQVAEGGHRQFAIAKYLDAIESGVPLIAPLPVEKLDIAEEASLDLFPSGSDFALDVPPSEHEVPLLLDSDVADEADAYQRARAAARAEAEAARREEIALMRQMSQREIDEFIEWAEHLMREETSQVQTTDFLSKELAAHLTGKSAQFSPKRIVRANELIKRYGYEAGLSRLSKDDPEIAMQIQRLRNQVPIPQIKPKKKE